MKKSACAFAVIALTVTAAPTAYGQNRTLTDYDGGPRTAISSIEVRNGQSVLKVDVRHRGLLYGDRLWIDTRGDDTGPEYELAMIANSDAGGFWRVETFKLSSESGWKCRGIRMHSDNYEPGSVSHFAIPQSCLEGPGSVRVVAESWNISEQYDVAPNYGEYQANSWFSPWIALG
jgi:hypothetical protein